MAEDIKKIEETLEVLIASIKRELETQFNQIFSDKNLSTFISKETIDSIKKNIFNSFNKELKQVLKDYGGNLQIIKIALEDIFKQRLNEINTIASDFKQKIDQHIEKQKEVQTDNEQAQQNIVNEQEKVLDATSKEVDNFKKKTQQAIESKKRVPLKKNKDEKKQLNKIIRDSIDKYLTPFQKRVESRITAIESQIKEIGKKKKIAQPVPSSTSGDKQQAKQQEKKAEEHEQTAEDVSADIYGAESAADDKKEDVDNKLSSSIASEKTSTGGGFIDVIVDKAVDVAKFASLGVAGLGIKWWQQITDKSDGEEEANKKKIEDETDKTASQSDSLWDDIKSFLGFGEDKKQNEEIDQTEQSAGTPITNINQQIDESLSSEYKFPWEEGEQDLNKQVEDQVTNLDKEIETAATGNAPIEPESKPQQPTSKEETPSADQPRPDEDQITDQATEQEIAKQNLPIPAKPDETVQGKEVQDKSKDIEQKEKEQQNKTSDEAKKLRDHNEKIQAEVKKVDQQKKDSEQKVQQAKEKTADIKKKSKFDELDEQTEKTPPTSNIAQTTQQSADTAEQQTKEKVWSKIKDKPVESKKKIVSGAGADIEKILEAHSKAITAKQTREMVEQAGPSKRLNRDQQIKFEQAKQKNITVAKEKEQNESKSALDTALAKKKQFEKLKAEAMSKKPGQQSITYNNTTLDVKELQDIIEMITTVADEISKTAQKG